MNESVWVGAIHVEDADHFPITIVESRNFRSDALSVMSEEDLVELKVHIATNPKCGTLIPHTGGVRKLRWRLAYRGKRTGSRVIYFYHSSGFPVFLLAFYKKGEKIDLTNQEKAKINKFVMQLVAEYRRKALRVVNS